MDIFYTLGTSLAVGSTAISYDAKKKEFNKKRVGTTTVLTGVTTVGGQISDKMTMDRIHKEYASAYIESMSDEELERALIALGELEKPENVNDITKTI